MEKQTLTILNISTIQFIGLTTTIKDFGFSICENEIVKKKNIIHFYELLQLTKLQKNKIFTKKVLEEMFYFFSEHEISIKMILSNEVLQIIKDFFFKVENR